MTYHSSVAYSNEDTVTAILDIHCKNGIDMDVTYSRGNFYKSLKSKPKYKFDNKRIDYT